MTPPFVSIIMPTRNEAGFISESLKSVLEQTYPPDRIEILIADGLSTDGTREIIQELAVKDSRIQLLDNPGRIVPTGLNLVLQRAKGEIIIRVDGHCVIDPSYVRNCVDHLLKDGIDGVGGSINTVGVDSFSETIAVAMSSVFGVGNSAFRTIHGKTMLVDSIPFPAFTRQMIEKVGLYDEELVRNQDDEYNYRIRAAGGRLLLAEDVRSKYYSRGTLGKLWRQYFQYGFYKVRVLQKHPMQMSPRQFVPPVFVFALLGPIVFGVFHSLGWTALALTGGAYLLANLMASFRCAARNGWKHLATLPVCFAILHLAYGLGFLHGLVKFCNRWGDKIGKTPLFSAVMGSDSISISGSQNEEIDPSF